MNRGKKRIGERYTTKEGYEIEIINAFSGGKYDVKFLVNNYVIRNVYYSDIKRNRVVNPEHKTVLDIGFFGIGKHRSIIKTLPSKMYQTWYSIFRRCYSDVFHKQNPTYIGCSVAEEWHNFQNFAEWYEENYIEGFELDKDILVKGNKIYGPNTCCFVPREINILFALRKNKRGIYPIGVRPQANGKFKAVIFIKNKGMSLGVYNTIENAFNVYKARKEKAIKDVALEYKSQLNNKTFLALLNYKIEITD